MYLCEWLLPHPTTPQSILGLHTSAVLIMLFGFAILVPLLVLSVWVASEDSSNRVP